MSEFIPETFLDLVKRTIQESSDAQGGPSTLVNATGAHKLHKDWVNQAWMFIQNKYTDWRFMYREGTLTWPAGVRQLGLVDMDLTGPGDQDGVNLAVGRQRLGRWPDAPTFRSWRASGDRGTETFLSFVPWDNFRTTYLRGTLYSQEGLPQYITIHPNRGLLLHPIPSTDEVIDLEYYRAAYPMGETLPENVTQDDDEPDMPAEYRMVLVYYALQKYGRKNAANEVYQDAHFEGVRLLKELEQNQRPTRPLSSPVGAGGYP